MTTVEKIIIDLINKHFNQLEIDMMECKSQLNTILESLNGNYRVLGSRIENLETRLDFINESMIN